MNISQVDHNRGDFGGGLYNRKGGTLVAIGSRFSDNTARIGAGLANGGTATLTSSEVIANTATGAARSGGVSGGGIDNQGTLTATSTQIKDNKATRNEPSTYITRGGGIANTFGATLTLSASLVTGNTVEAIDGEAHGGGIYNGDATATLSSTDVSNNRASSLGGSAQGGGIFKTEAGSVTLISSSVTGNHPNNCHPLNSIAGCID